VGSVEELTKSFLKSLGTFGLKIVPPRLPFGSESVLTPGRETYRRIRQPLVFAVVNNGVVLEETDSPLVNPIQRPPSVDAVIV
jgi:hypothetical protein